MVYTEQNAEWLQQIAPERFNDEELFKIVIFFVFHSPCTGLSARGRSLSDYGWDTPWKKPFKLNLQLKQAAANYELLFSAEKYEKMESALAKADLKENFPSNLGKERICVHNSKKNQFMSVFYHIRNSMAHGRLNMVDVDGECVFIFEDAYRKNDRFRVSARMILRKRTLLNWIELIENGPREYQKNHEKRGGNKK